MIFDSKNIFSPEEERVLKDINAQNEHLSVNMNTEDFLGWFTLLIIIFIAFLFIKKNPKTRNFLFVALFLRSSFVIVDQYFFALPGSMMDGWTFEHITYNYSQTYGLNIIYQLFDGSSYFLSKIMSILYTLTNTRSPMMANMISVAVGTATVYLIYRLTYILWGDRIALKAGWFAALFPSLVLYSAIMLREIYVVFFTTYALIWCVNFIDKRKFIYFIKSFLGFFGAALFHGPMMLGFLIFLMYIFFSILKENNYFIRFKKKNIYQLVMLPLFLIPIVTYLLGYYTIPKLGDINNFGNIKLEDQSKVSNLKERLIYKIGRATRSTFDSNTGSSFPSWTVPEDTAEIIYLTPVRMFYFLYAPFPWDIKRPTHLMGLFDVIFYIYLSFCIFRNRKILFENPKTRFLIIVFAVYVAVYSFGVGNFGTTIRHRVKFVEILIAIAAPLILKIKFSKIRLN